MSKYIQIVMTNGTYTELIEFCAKLTIKQLTQYKNHVKYMKNKPYQIAREVLKIRIKKIK